ncbi:MAG: hypothetical protein UV42_C0012G0038 [Candidatus Magasanikbacteria bacterium GW2011_GWE2_42_7]|uniref:Lipoprotein n=1 Tax=Candidatus Magasanikbacteria bacterium GW2011_GWE2_42_7 TaxID=1619052 RepID=A0A0G1DN13_9BACT|nr:MAG: hypothetical protein UV42_C0012G0038 [Candidatus Magasanikbacteria bacterium GW2011_GWE2_42_7]
MKYLALLFVLTLAGCGPVSTIPEITIPSDPSSREIVQHFVEGSCFSYSLVEGGKEVALPNEIIEAFSCPATMPVLSHDKQKLAYVDTDLQVHIHYIDRKKDITAHNINPDQEGVGPLIWNDTDDRLASVEVSQRVYPMLTQICVQNIDTTLVECVDAKVNFSCGSVCSSVENDIQFTSNREITYTTWDEVPYDLDGTIESIKVLAIE